MTAYSLVQEGPTVLAAERISPSVVLERINHLWDKVFASMGQGNAKWATGDIKRALVEEMAESGSETEEASEPVI